jgi:uncharacterized protein (TIGR03067 family)
MRCLAIALALFLLAAPLLAGGKPEAPSFKGTWNALSYERGGRVAPDETARMIKFSFADDKMTLLQGIGFTGSKECKFKLDATKKPATIDLSPQEGRNKDKPFEGIFELKGDELRLCFAAPGTPRPKEFVTKAGEPVLLIVLKREK